MLKFHLRISLVLLFLGFILGYSASSLFTGGKLVANKPAAYTPKELKKEANAIEESYQIEIANLRGQNSELQQNLELAKASLQQAKQSVKTKEAQIKKKIEPQGYLAKDLLRKAELPSIVSTRYSACDSLVTEINEYINENSRKDSIYEAQLSRLDSVISVKEAIINIQEKAKEDFHNLLGRSLAEQENLHKENKHLRKQAKRQKFKNSLLKIGTIILAGLAANEFLKN